MWKGRAVGGSSWWLRSARCSGMGLTIHSRSSGLRRIRLCRRSILVFFGDMRMVSGEVRAMMMLIPLVLIFALIAQLHLNWRSHIPHNGCLFLLFFLLRCHYLSGLLGQFRPGI